MDATYVAENGVINERTATQMAIGAAWSCRADVGISATGVAGPTVRTASAPALSGSASALPMRWDDRVRARKLQLTGDRADIRSQTIAAALAWLVERLAEPAHH